MPTGAVAVPNPLTFDQVQQVRSSLASLLRGVAPEVANPLNVESRDLATPQSSGSLVLFLIHLPFLDRAERKRKAILTGGTAPPWYGPA